MVKPLFIRNLKNGLKFVVVFSLILAMYIGMIVYMYDPQLASMLEKFQDYMPGMMSAVGMMATGSTLLEFMNSYLYGFIMLVIPMVFTMLLVNSYIVRYVDSGTIACLLVTPHSRRKLIDTQIISIVIMEIVIMVIATVIGVVSAEIMFAGQLDIGKYIEFNVSTLMLQLMIAGICFLAACMANETRLYMMIGVGLPLIFYIIKMLANMGGKLEAAKYLTIFSMTPYNNIIAGKSGVISSNLLMAGIALILFGIGREIFIKKDMSV